jgi:2'-5' RNA ligase
MKALFFIGLVLPDPPAGDIQKIKQSISERYRNRHGLFTPPHVTLAAPFRMTLEEAGSLREAMAVSAAPFRPVRLVLEGYGTFGRRVLYIAVHPDPVLSQLHTVFSGLVPREQKEERPFVPHVTLAHKDLSPEDLLHAREDTGRRQFRADAEVREVSLLEHSGSRWEVTAAVPLFGI